MAICQKSGELLIGKVPKIWRVTSEILAEMKLSQTLVEAP